MPSDNPIQKVFILGLDAASYPLVDEWMRDGCLPNLAKVRREGAFGLLRSLPVANSAAAWTSIITGVNPGKHGITDFYVPKTDSYDIRFLCGGDRRAPTYWQLLPQLRHIVVNVPMTYPADALNGLMISGLDAPGMDSKGFCFPPDLMQEINEEVGHYILHPGIFGHFLAGEVDRGVQSLTEAMERRLATVLHLMRKHEWDCFQVVFSTLDLAQHCFWKYFDPTHPNHDPSEARRYGDVIPNLYRRMDAVVGTIMEELPNDCLLMVISDHGAGPKHSATHQVMDWLESKGWLSYRGAKAGGVRRGFLRKAYSVIEQRVSRRGKDRLLKLLPGIRNRVRSRMAYASIDWARTRVYADNVAPSLRINLKGREPQGIVEPGEEYERLLTEVSQSLLDLRNPSLTMEPLVSEVHRSDDLYHGESTALAPDLLFRWNDHITVKAISDDLPPPNPPTGELAVISGDHHPDGIIGLWGPNIVPACDLSACLYDVLPALLAILGIASPPGLDGHVLSECFHRPLAAGGKAGGTTSPETPPQPADVLTADDSDILRERLRGLGYVE